MGHAVPEIVTGKPLGARRHRRRASAATGLGVVYVAEARLRAARPAAARPARRRSRASATSARVAAARAARDRREGRRRSPTTPAASSTRAGSTSPAVAALDRPSTASSRAARSATRSGAARCSRSPCDMLIPAALERQITAENAAGCSCRLVVEAANGPTTPEAEAILAARGIAGRPRRPRQRRRRHRQLLRVGPGPPALLVGRRRHPGAPAPPAARRARTRRPTTPIALGVDWRTAALSVAIERVAEAARLRAIYP